MYVVKKLHIPIEEKDIINLQTGEFIAWGKSGVHTVKVRKRVCPHGADTPLVAPAPFAAGVNQTLGSLKESILKAVEAKKKEKSLVERLQSELSEKNEKIKELEKKADIKIAVSEMLKGEKTTKETPNITAKITELTKTYENRITTLEHEKKDKIERILVLESEKAALQEKFKAYEPLDKALTTIIESKLATHPSMNVRNMPSDVPSEIVVGQELPRVTVLVKKPVVETDEGNWRGRLILLVADGLWPVDWRRVQKMNWTALLGLEGGVTVEKTPSSVIVHVETLYGRGPAELLDLARQLADRTARALMQKYGCRLAEGRLCRRPHIAVDDPVAEFLSRYFEISVDEKKIDRSEGLGEIDHFTLDGAVDYLLMPERVKALEGKVEAINGLLEELVGDVHQLVKTFKECTSQNGGVPEHILRREPNGRV